MIINSHFYHVVKFDWTKVTLWKITFWWNAWYIKQLFLGWFVIDLATTSFFRTIRRFWCCQLCFASFFIKLVTFANSSVFFSEKKHLPKFKLFIFRFRSPLQRMSYFIFLLHVASKKYVIEMGGGGVKHANSYFSSFYYYYFFHLLSKKINRKVQIIFFDPFSWTSSKIFTIPSCMYFMSLPREYGASKNSSSPKKTHKHEIRVFPKILQKKLNFLIFFVNKFNIFL